MIQNDGVSLELDTRAKVYSDLSIIKGSRRQAGRCTRVVGKYRVYVNNEQGRAEPVYTVLNTKTMQVYSATGNFNKILILLAKAQW